MTTIQQTQSNKPQATKLKKFAIREVELKTTTAAAYVCWICSNCW